MFYQCIKQSREEKALLIWLISTSQAPVWAHGDITAEGHWGTRGSRVNTSWQFKTTTQKAFLSWPHTKMEHTLAYTQTHTQEQQTGNGSLRTFAAADGKSISRRPLWNCAVFVILGLFVAVIILRGQSSDEVAKQQARAHLQVCLHVCFEISIRSSYQSFALIFTV